MSEASTVYAEILDRIVNGPLDPGTVVRDADLAAELGVSRTPVREALIRMSQEGLVQFHRGRNTVVTEIDLVRAGEYYDVGAVLDGFAASLAAARIDGATADRMAEILAQMEASSDPRELARLDLEFHDIYYRAAGSEVLCDTLQRVVRETMRTERVAFAQSGLRAAAHDEHLMILGALRANDAALAQAAAAANWRNSWRRLSAVLESGPSPVEGKAG
ncbi:GntR family transcriptional regulator [Mariniluteicoccus flavus]